MNRKMIRHGLLIVSIVIAAFFAAALTPAKTYAKTSGTPAVTNIAKVDYESRTERTAAKMIVDNEVPLQAAPLESGSVLPTEWIIVAAAAVVTGIIIIMDRKNV